MYLAGGDINLRGGIGDRNISDRAATGCARLPELWRGPHPGPDYKGQIVATTARVLAPISAVLAPAHAAFWQN
jgi:hypothetical protein